MESPIGLRRGPATLYTRFAQAVGLGVFIAQSDADGAKQVRRGWLTGRYNAALALRERRGGRVVEGARLERVYTGNRIEGSNPSPSATNVVKLLIL